MSSNESDTKTRILEATWKLLEERHGLGVSMSDIARAAGISRQAVYLHFSSRTELMVATTQYVDEAKGLNERLNQLNAATSGIDLLEACVDVWCNYIPEIYGIAKALLNIRETDEAAAAAWDGSMGCLRDVCRQIVQALEGDGMLASEWTHDEAVEMMYTLLSIQNWEQLTRESGWSTGQYVKSMKKVMRRIFVEHVVCE
jgi:AcrR family transcriptional regulator